MADSYQVTERRPLKSRDRKSMQMLAGWLAARDVSPNLISVLGCVAGCEAGVLLWTTPSASLPGRRLIYLVAASLVQLRLLANLLDGMVAVASGKASALGELFNEVPDRISDAVILVGAGYALGSNPALGYVAACLAIMTAYVRAVGKTATGVNDFCGPMAKPHRMFVVTLASLVSALTPAWYQGYFIFWALVLITLGSAITVFRRVYRITLRLRSPSC